jgi:hypothetical protein
VDEEKRKRKWGEWMIFMGGGRGPGQGSKQPFVDVTHARKAAAVD